MAKKWKLVTDSSELPEGAWREARAAAVNLLSQLPIDYAASFLSDVVRDVRQNTKDTARLSQLLELEEALDAWGREELYLGLSAALAEMMDRRLAKARTGGQEAAEP